MAWLQGCGEDAVPSSPTAGNPWDCCDVSIPVRVGCEQGSATQSQDHQAPPSEMGVTWSVGAKLGPPLQLHKDPNRAASGVHLAAQGGGGGLPPHWDPADSVT